MNLTAAATPCHNAFPVFCDRFSFFLLEPDPTGGFKRGPFLVGKLVVRNNSNAGGACFVSSSTIKRTFERENEP